MGEVVKLSTHTDHVAHLASIAEGFALGCTARAHLEAAAEYLERIDPVSLAAVVKPGETLVMRSDRELSIEEFKRLRIQFDGLEQSFGVRMIMVESLTPVAIFKPEDYDGEDTRC
jgi:hypothetical protein